MSDLSHRPPSPFALTGIIVAAGAVAIGLGLGVPLLSLVLEARGVSGTWIGLNTATAGLASLIATPLAGPLAHRIGPARLMIWSLAVSAATFLAFHFVENLVGWFVLRGLFHGALSFAFVMSEYWIVSRAPPERRGLMIGIYATMFSVGLAIGPMILAAVGSAGLAPFAIGAAILALAPLAVAFASGSEPELEEAPSVAMGTYVRAVPVATWGAFAFGAVETGGLSILPLHGLGVGLDEARAAMLLTAVGLGNVALQIPIGLMSDRFDTRRLIALVSVIGVVGCVALPFAAASFWLMLAILFVWGGFVAGLYTLGLAVMGARFSGADLAGANAAFLFMYALGMLVGPGLIGAGLDLSPAFGAPLVMGAFFLGHLGVVFMTRAEARRDRGA